MGGRRNPCAEEKPDARVARTRRGIRAPHPLVGGERAAFDQLLPLLHDTLHPLAVTRLRGERSEHTPQPTAHVKEACFRLVDQERTHWWNRAQFFGIAVPDSRQGHVDDFRLLTGLDAEEAAEVPQMSARSIERHWRSPRAWLGGGLTAS